MYDHIYPKRAKKTKEEKVLFISLLVIGLIIFALYQFIFDYTVIKPLNNYVYFLEQQIKTNK